MKVLITGANGMVARTAAKYCASIGDNVFAFTRKEFNIADAEFVRRTFETVRPDIVLNCAAYTNVDGAESNVEGCYAANSTGPENLARAAMEFGAVNLTISTDYVFGGDNDGFYTEDDKPDPQSVYAKAKFEGEERAVIANPETIIVRSGWIYGEDGTNFLCVIPSLLKQGNRIKAISDSFGTSTFASDLVARMRQLAGLKTSGIYHVANSGYGQSYFEFAQAVAEVAGYDASLIEPVLNDSLKRPAPRPASSKLASVRSEALGLPPIREWREALSEFLQK